MVPVVLWYHSAQLDELYNFGFSRRRPQGRFSSWKKAPSPSSKSPKFSKSAATRRSALRCARRALSKPLQSNKMGLRPCVCQGIFRASIAPHMERLVSLPLIFHIVFARILRAGVHMWGRQWVPNSIWVFWTICPDHPC